jgi:DNA-binding MarR family transcriptional regulator
MVGQGEEEHMDEPRWLDADERAVWLNLSGLIMKLAPALDQQLERDAGLSFIEYMVLAVLSEQPGRSMRMSQIAGMTGSSLSRLSHIASRLENDGYIGRTADPEDGRFIVATLTDAGFAKVVATAPGHVEAVRALVMDPLTRGQLRNLGTAVGLLFERVDPEGSRQVKQRMVDPID